MELESLKAEWLTELEKAMLRRCAVLFMICCASSVHADQASIGKALLERNCGSCHAVVPGSESPRAAAPNLSIVLQAYLAERLQSELTEGIRPKHPEMPQGSLHRADLCQCRSRRDRLLEGLEGQEEERCEAYAQATLRSCCWSSA